MSDEVHSPPLVQKCNLKLKLIWGFISLDETRLVLICPGSCV